MLERAQREGVLVQVRRLMEQLLDEVAGADVMQEVTVKLVRVGKVAQVLNDGTSVGIRARYLQLLRRGVREAVDQERLERRLPGAFDDGLVREQAEAPCRLRNASGQEQHDREADRFTRARPHGSLLFFILY